MTPNILENISTWLVDWSLITIMDNTTPPRDPNDENDEDDETTTTRGRTSRRSSENPTNSRRARLNTARASAFPRLSATGTKV